MKKITTWISNNKVEFAFLLLILLIGAFCRLYKIDQYMTFLGDEGRDVLIVRRLLVEHHPPLIGPGTSIGNMYLGPAYYYMMALPLLFANYNPVGPAIFIALLGLVTIWFVWWVTREWFGNIGALATAFLYAISPVVIIYSRSSWNPNIMPFFALLTIYSTWRVWTKQQYKWLIIAGISYAMVLQSHYLGLLLLPVIIVIWFLTLITSKNTRHLILITISSVVLFLLLMSPLAIFDSRHNFINSKAIISFFSARQTTVSIKPWNAIPQIPTIFTQITTDLVASKTAWVGAAIAIIIFFYFIYQYFFHKEKYDLKQVSIIFTLTMWLGFALLGFGLYKQHIYDHYYGFIFVVPFILLGAIVQKISCNRYLGWIAVSILLLILTFVDFQNSPLRYSPNMQLQRAQTVAKKVEEIAGGSRFNFALIADNNYDSAYRYFLNLDHALVVDINPQDTKDTITNELIVVCEKAEKDCDPTHNAKTEIAAWGWSKIENEYLNVFGVTIFKLAHVPAPAKK